MRRSMIPTALLQVAYQGDVYYGDSNVHTVQFDADGGTGGEGLLTLIDQNGTNTVDFGDGSHGDLGKVVDAVNALTDWAARIPLGLARAQSVAVADMATHALADFDDGAGAGVTVLRNAYTSVLVPTDDYLTFPENATTDVSSPLAVELVQFSEAVIDIEFWGETGIGAGDVTLYLFGCNPQRSYDPDLGRVKTLYEALDDAEWSTVPVDDETLVEALNGSTHVRKQWTIDFAGLGFLRLAKVTNPDASKDVYVRAWINHKVYSPA